MRHVASQKKISFKCAMGSSVDTSGGGAQVVGGANPLRKGPWSPEEDALLIKYVKHYGEGNWKNVQRTGLMRCGKSCRLRWTNHLKPDLKKGPFSFQEESIVIQLHRKVGNKWSKIASKLPGRTDNEVKNFWNTKIKKRMMESSPQPIEENVSSTQQSEVNETPSSLPSMNSPTSLLSPQNSNFNSSKPCITPKTTFSLTNSHRNPSMGAEVNLLADSKMHEDPMISFPNNSTYLISFSNEEGDQNNPSLIQNLPPTSMSNVFHNPSINNPNANPFQGAYVLEFATGSTYYNPNPFPSVVLPPIPDEPNMVQTTASASIYKYHNSFGYVLDDGVWNGSLSFEPNIKLEVQEQDVEMTSIWVGAENDQLSSFNGSNYYYDGLSTMEVTPEKELSMEFDEMESMDEELSSLLNAFSFGESPPELHLKTRGENTASSYRTHYYLDQKVAFPSFSGTTVAAATALGSDSLCSTSSEFEECIDADDWIINTPESSL